ncbi:glycoside hydrolase family 36 protein [Gleimia hominis]|uniref:glycoside hydrolase family 36 protein n=1 Tax=Gleimia hominis TaxID=595468 RepID=UPI000C8057A0|nr:glycoside hydrolase family 36 protein [Gleimia hominis]WIK63903.1 alpha-galactosidase [Gleimia hominis]
MRITSPAGTIHVDAPAPGGQETAGGDLNSGHLIKGTHVKVTHNWGALEYYRHGWNSWTPTRWWSLERDPWRIWDNPLRSLTAEDVVNDSTTKHCSSMVTAVVSEQGEVLLVGALSGSTPVLTLTPNTIEATCIDAGSAHANGGAWFVTTGAEQEVFARYAKALAQYRQLPEREQAVDVLGAVWSSWYSWFEEVSEQIITSEIPAAKKLGYGVVQIDDGWERKVGDWRANQKFPRGMKPVVDDIHQAGLKAGLWVSPFIALPGTPTVEAYPELFLHNEDGSLTPSGFNWGQEYYALDFSKPQAHDWLAETMSEIAGWGFDMFKLDFLYAAAVQAQRQHGMDREVAYRAGLETMREAVGNDVYLLGSGAVVNASLGVLDGMRVGPDTAPYWDNTERKRDPSGPAVVNALRNSLSRTWLKTLADCDPDVAYFRTRGSLLSPEVNALTAQAGLVCGFAQCSDPREWLSEEEAALVQRWIKEFNNHPHVEQVSRYTYRVDGQEVNFDEYLNPTSRISDRLLVK